MTRYYSEIRNELKTGDIVLFAGKSALSDVIRYSTLSKWSHCGLIVKLPEYDFLSLWESTPVADMIDLDSCRRTKGVQLVPLSERVKHYSGGISVRLLQGNELPNDAVARLMALRYRLRNIPYEDSKMELLKAVYDGPLGDNDEDLSSIFCSELLAEAYQCLGLLSSAVPSNEYTPADFSALRLSHLENGFTLSQEIILKDG